MGLFYVFLWDFFLDLVIVLKVIKFFFVEDFFMVVLVKSLSVDFFYMGSDLFNVDCKFNSVVL